ncbi:hypothetical protein QG37_02399 [Candidozyma auris]|uniref:Uncharacterized protein n=1 Tax=Candidozyma auris TaxID=498019 RepID=A0A0L0P271_CANAR|nr:hypothetical protein QG37_02399 [[Candida] auris]
MVLEVVTKERQKLEIRGVDARQELWRNMLHRREKRQIYNKYP